MHDDAELDTPPPPSGRWLDAENAWTYLLPMAVYLGLSSFEPAAPSPGQPAEPGVFGLTYDHYPAIYTVKLAITAGVLWLCRASWGQWPLLKNGKLNVSPTAIGVGVVGVVLWIACCELRVETKLVEAVGGPESPAMGVLGLLGLGAERPAFNPLERIDNPATRYGFLAVRFLGLAILVPIFEELMLRGWLMRTMVSPNLWRVPFGRVTAASVVVGTAFPMLYHPEKLASLVWFSLVTWLMVRTKNYWDCVAAHSITNLLLGLYVLWAGAWHLW
ncbi:CAAX amino terminal protease self- immunity [Botrimarina colliarenosi]|uniref:CAAX amino terminal protease self-immunity n=1 Tax=Botrimarina colliarenosi TaxID=2528001 RepID=A0A5C6AK45_9BACT|nr:CAAX prenyl protease-related protein [Botrimarina colliarenosi]TWU00403.1 CAAX amino terminal protease self- immunity [Botrimarina colliarenosi]